MGHLESCGSLLPPTHASTHSLMHSLAYSISDPPTHPHTCSQTHSLTHSLSLAYSFTHPLTHPLTCSRHCMQGRGNHGMIYTAGWRGLWHGTSTTTSSRSPLLHCSLFAPLSLPPVFMILCPTALPSHAPHHRPTPASFYTPFSVCCAIPILSACQAAFPSPFKMRLIFC